MVRMKPCIKRIRYSHKVDKENGILAKTALRNKKPPRLKMTRIAFSIL
jgi:hypothetical protein